MGILRYTSSSQIALAVLIALLLLWPQHAVALPNPPPPPAGVTLTFEPIKPVFDWEEPFDFRLTLRNDSTSSIEILTHRIDPADNTSASETIEVSTVQDRPTTTPLTYYLRPYLLRIKRWNPTALTLFTKRGYTEIAPGTSFETFVYLEEGSDFSRWPDKSATSITVQAKLSYSLAPTTSCQNEARFPAYVVESKPASYAIKPRGSSAKVRVYHDTLRGWWETIDLTLVDNGRFVYLFSSDAGGDWPAVKGRYTEDDKTVRLFPIFSNEMLGFKHPQWVKSKVASWDVLVKPDDVHKLTAQPDPKLYPILSPVSDQETTDTWFVRPWDKQQPTH